METSFRNPANDLMILQTTHLTKGSPRYCPENTHSACPCFPHTETEPSINMEKSFENIANDNMNCQTTHLISGLPRSFPENLHSAFPCCTHTETEPITNMETYLDKYLFTESTDLELQSQNIQSHKALVMMNPYPTQISQFPKEVWTRLPHFVLYSQDHSLLCDRDITRLCLDHALSGGFDFYLYYEPPVYKNIYKKSDNYRYTCWDIEPSSTMSKPASKIYTSNLPEYSFLLTFECSGEIGHQWIPDVDGDFVIYPLETLHTETRIEQDFGCTGSVENEHIPKSYAPNLEEARLVIRQSGEEPHNKELKERRKLVDRPVEDKFYDLDTADEVRNKRNARRHREHKKREAQVAELEEKMKEIKTDETFIATKNSNRKLKAKARAEYAARHPHAPPPKLYDNISKYLNYDQETNLSTSERIFWYNKKHKCPHGKRFNVFTPNWNNEEVTHLTPSCDHHLEHYGENLLEPCGNCGRSLLHTVNRKDCLCDIKQCKFCHFTTYYYDKFNIWQEVCVCGSEKQMSMAQYMRVFFKQNKPRQWEGKPRFSSKQNKIYIDDELFPPLEASSDKKEPPKGKRGDFKNAAPLDITAVIPEVRKEEVPETTGEARIVEKQGGVQSSLASAWATIKSKLQEMKDSMRKYWNAFSVRRVVKSAFNGLLDGIKFLFETVLANPLETVLLGMALRDLFFGTNVNYARIGLEIVVTLKHLGIFNEFARVLGLKTVTQHSKLRHFKWLYELLGIRLDNVVEKQGGCSSTARGLCSDYFSKFVDFVSNILGFSRKMWNVGTMANHAKNFNAIFQTGKNLGTIFSLIIGFLPNFIQDFLVERTAEGYIAQQLKLKESPISLALQAASLTRVMCLQNQQPVAVNEQRKLASRLFADAVIDIESKKLRPSRKSEEFLTLLRKLNSELDPESQPRKEPFCIFVTGKPGTRKSTLAPALLAPLFPGKSIDQIRDLIFTRNPGVEEWSGYDPYKHQVILYDDFAQSREERDLLELINLVSVAEMVLDMPSIEAGPLARKVGVKGTTMQAPIVVCLSNLETITPTTLVSSDAIQRRLNKCALRAQIGPDNQTHFVPINLALKHSYLALMEVADTMTVYEAQKYIRQKYEATKVQQETIKVNLAQYAWPSEDNTVKTENDESGESEEEEYDESDEEISFGDVPRTIKRESGGIYRAAAAWSSLAIAGVSIFGMTFAVTTLIDSVLDIFAGRFSWKSLVSGLVVVGCALTTYLHLTGHFQVEAHSGETNTPKVTRKVIVQADRGERNVIRKNMIHLNRVEGERIQWVNGLFIGAQDILTVDHFFHGDCDGYVPEGTMIQIRELSVEATSIKFPFEKKRLCKLSGSEDKDVCVYRLPHDITHPRRDITGHFSDDNPSRKGARVVFYQYDKLTHDVSKTITTITDKNVYIKYEISQNGKEEMKGYTDTIYYALDSSFGDCGGPVILDDGAQPVIVAIHVAGDKAYESGVGSLVTRSQVKRAQNALSADFVSVGMAQSTVKECAELYVTKDEIVKQGLTGTLYCEGKSSHMVHSPTKTDILPSPLHDAIFPHNTEPSALSNQDPRLEEKVDILKRGVQKWSITPEPFPEKVMDEVCNSMAEEICAIQTHVEKRVLEWDEVINGVPELPYVDSLNMKSSAGSPFCFSNALKGEKRKLFTLENDRYVIANTQLKELLEERDANLKKGLRTPGRPWIDTLKDERRPIAKVRAGKTRVFTVAPVDYIMCSRKYNLTFAAHWYQCRIKTFSAVGINRGSLEWHRLVKRLLEVGEQGFDGDFEKFDGTLMAQIVQRFIIVLDKFYDKKNHKERVALLHEVSYCAHQVRDLVFYQNGGMCSGVDLTAIINSWVSEAYLRCVWCLVMPAKYNSMYYYRMWVRTAIYGDDNWVATERTALQWFNQLSVAAVLAEHQMGYTPAHKNAMLQTCIPVTSCMFLKNNTGKLRGFYVAQMDEEANLETLNWIRKCDDHDKACEDNCNTVLRNAFFSGKEYFNNLREKIISRKPNYNLITFDPLFVEYFTFGYVNSDTNDFGFTRTVSAFRVMGNHEKEDSFYQPFLTEEQVDGERQVMFRQVIKQSFFTSIGKEADNLISSFMPEEIVGDVLGAILDKPADPVNPLPYVRKDQQYFSNSRNIECLEKLTLDPSAQQLCDAEHFGTHRPETTIRSLISRPTFLGSFKWRTSDDTGTLLTAVKVGPLDDFFDGPDFTVPQDLSLLSYTSNFFQYWRGGIRYIFQIIASSFHEGRIDIENHPCVKDVPVDLNAAASQYMTSYSLRNTGNEFQVVVPFESDVVWKRVYRGGKLADIRADGVEKFTDYFTGTLAVRVAAPLKAPSTVVPEVTVNMFIAGGVDFELNYAGIMGQSIVPTELTTSGRVRKVVRQSGEAKIPENLGEQEEEGDGLDSAVPDLEVKEGVGLAEQVQPVPIMQVQAPVDSKGIRAQLHLGELPWSLDNMLARFNLVGTYNWKIGDAVNTSIFTLDVLKDCLNNPNAAIPFQRFMNFRCDNIIFRVQLTGSRFHQGNAIVAYVPSQRSKAYYTQTYSAARLASVQSAFLNPAGGTTLDFNIPTTFYKGWIDLVNDDTYGQFHCKVFNELLAVEGSSTSVAIKVFVSVVGAQFKIPRPGTTTWTDVQRELVAPRLVRKQSGATSTAPKPKIRTSKQTIPFSMNSSSKFTEEGAIILAPSRCITKDPKVPHFGEKYTDMLQLCKRYVPWVKFRYQPESQSPYYVRFPKWEGLCPGDLEDQTPFFRIATMYRNFRGGLNFKVRVRKVQGEGGADNDWHGFVMFLGDTFRDSALLGNNIADTLPNINPKMLGSIAPRAYFSATQTAELQVPFLSQSATRLISHSGDNEPTYDNIFDDNFCLVACFLSDMPEQHEWDIEVHVAFADETHIGTFIGAPIVVGQTRDPGTPDSAAPDAWVVAKPSLK